MMKKIISLLLVSGLLATSLNISLASDMPEYSVYAEKDFVEITFTEEMDSANVTVADVVTGETVSVSGAEFDGTQKVYTAELASDLELDKVYSVTVSDGTNSELSYFRLDTVFSDKFDYASDEALNDAWTLSASANVATIKAENGAMKFDSQGPAVNEQCAILPPGYTDTLKTKTDYVVEYEITNCETGTSSWSNCYVLMDVRDTNTAQYSASVDGIALGFGDRLRARQGSTTDFNISGFKQYADGVDTGAVNAYPRDKTTFAYAGKISVKGNEYNARLTSLNENNTASVIINNKTQYYQEYTYTYTMPDTMSAGGFKIMCRGIDFSIDNLYVYSFAEVTTEDFSGFDVYAEKDMVEVSFANALQNPDALKVSVKEYVSGTAVVTDASATFEENGKAGIVALLDGTELKLDTVYNVTVSDGIVSVNTNFILDTIISDTFDYDSTEALQKKWITNTDNENIKAGLKDGAMYIPYNTAQISIYPSVFEQLKTETDYVVEYDAEFKLGEGQTTATRNGSYLMAVVRETSTTNYRMNNTSVGQVNGIGISIADRSVIDINNANIGNLASENLAVYLNGKLSNANYLYPGTNPYSYNTVISVRGNSYIAEFNATATGNENIVVNYAIPDGTMTAGGFKFFERYAEVYIDNFYMYKCSDVESEDLSDVSVYAERDEINVTLPSAVKDIGNLSFELIDKSGETVDVSARLTTEDTVTLSPSGKLGLDKIYTVTVSDALKSVSKTFMLKKYIYDDFSTYSTTEELREKWIIGAHQGEDDGTWGVNLTDDNRMDLQADVAPANGDYRYTVLYNPNILDMSELSDYVVEFSGESKINATTNTRFGVAVRETSTAIINATAGAGGNGMVTSLKYNSTAFADKGAGKTIGTDYTFLNAGVESTVTDPKWYSIGETLDMKVSVVGDKYEMNSKVSTADGTVKSDLGIIYDIPETSNDTGYVKLCVNGFGMLVDEIAVYAYTEDIEEMLYVYEGEKATVSENTVSGSFKLMNTYSTDKDFEMVVAVYEKNTNRLLGTQVISDTAAAGVLTEDGIEYSVLCEDGTIGEVKLILLNSLKTLEPYGAPQIFVY